MPALPRAPADLHLKTFGRAGWRLDRVTGSHYVLVKEGVDFHHLRDPKRPHPGRQSTRMSDERIPGVSYAYSYSERE